MKTVHTDCFFRWVDGKENGGEWRKSTVFVSFVCLLLFCLLWWDYHLRYYSMSFSFWYFKHSVSSVFTQKASQFLLLFSQTLKPLGEVRKFVVKEPVSWGKRKGDIVPPYSSFPKLGQEEKVKRRFFMDSQSVDEGPASQKPHKRR